DDPISLSLNHDHAAFVSRTSRCYSAHRSFNAISFSASKAACEACEEAVLFGSAGAPTPESCANVSLTATGTAANAVCYGASITQPTSVCIGAGCTDTVTASATGPGGSTIAPKMATATCSILQLNSGLNVTKNWQAGLTAAGSGLG